VLDAYNRRARLVPAALAALPALCLLGGSLLALEDAGSVLAFALSGVAVVICGVVRDAGLRLEPALWAGWGGAPTTQRLRWRGNDALEVTRLHERLATATGGSLPTATEEDTDPEVADASYIAAVADLRELTRDKSTFPLVAEENAEYGMRRNCFGLRPIAILMALLVAAAGTVLAATNDWPVRFTLPAFVGAVAALVWWRLVTESWIRQAGERYATRLFEALARL
jgi:hypothetical protein